MNKGVDMIRKTQGKIDYSIKHGIMIGYIDGSQNVSAIETGWTQTSPEQIAKTLLEKFPTKEDLADYYWSTLLWRDSLERLENYDLQALKESTLNEISKLDNLIIKKQICCLSGIN